MKRLLYVGAGYDRGTPFPALFEGYDVVRLDADPDTQPHIEIDALRLHDIGNQLTGKYLKYEGFDGVALAHTLEHFTEQEGATVLTGCKRVLAPGGRIAISVPNLRLAAEAFLTHPNTIVYMTDHGKPIRAADMLFGWQWSISEGEGHPLMVHKWGYTADTLRDALVAAGFVDVTVMDDRERGNTEIHGYAVKP